MPAPSDRNDASERRPYHKARLFQQRASVMLSPWIALPLADVIIRRVRHANPAALQAARRGVDRRPRAWHGLARFAPASYVSSSASRSLPEIPDPRHCDGTSSKTSQNEQNGQPLRSTAARTKIDVGFCNSARTLPVHGAKDAARWQRFVQARSDSAFDGPFMA